MKLLFAYDDTDPSRAALYGLISAGLPDDVDATVLTVRKVGDDTLLETDADQGYISLTLPVATKTVATLDRGLAIATEGETALRNLFPRWHIRAAARGADSPAEGILEEIATSRPEMVVIGTHHRSRLGRLTHGSVARRVLAEAGCSLRIGHTERRSSDVGLRIVIGLDGSNDALAAVAEIARRRWPAGTVVRLVSVTNGMPYGVVPPEFEAADWPATLWSRRRGHAMQEAITRAVEILDQHGILAMTEAAVGNPGSTLVEIADEWEADLIVLGARAHDLLERVVMGSVSSRVVARSKCAVEIVRSGIADRTR